MTCKVDELEVKEMGVEDLPLAHAAAGMPPAGAPSEIAPFQSVPVGLGTPSRVMEGEEHSAGEGQYVNFPANLAGDTHSTDSERHPIPSTSQQGATTGMSMTYRLPPEPPSLPILVSPASAPAPASAAAAAARGEVDSEFEAAEITAGLAAAAFVREEEGLGSTWQRKEQIAVGAREWHFFVEGGSRVRKFHRSPLFCPVLQEGHPRKRRQRKVGRCQKGQKAQPRRPPHPG